MAKSRVSAGLTTFATFTLSFIALSNLSQCAAVPTNLVRRDIWKPSAGLTWDYQLTGTIDVESVNVDVWDIDLFDATSTTIDAIHAQGKHVICYFSAGSFEDWRDDASQFQASDKGSSVEGWDGENWLNTKSSNVRNIMVSRLDMAAQKKCDGVEPDNVDAYDNSNGLGLKSEDAVDYVTFLAEAAHSRNMAIALKNARSIVTRLVDTVEFSVQEECVQYGNCDEFQPFIEAGKPVFHVEYSDGGNSKRDLSKKHKSDKGEAYEDNSNEDEFYMDDSDDEDVEEEDGEEEDTEEDESGDDKSGEFESVREYDGRKGASMNKSVGSSSNAGNSTGRGFDSNKETNWDKNDDASSASKDLSYTTDGDSDDEDLTDEAVFSNEARGSSSASNTDVSASRVSTAGKSTATVSANNKVVSAGGSSGCAVDVPGFSSIVKNLDLDAWVQICS